jgi:hypothetical protein
MLLPARCVADSLLSACEVFNPIATFTYTGEPETLGLYMGLKGTPYGLLRCIELLKSPVDYRSILVRCNVEAGEISTRRRQLPCGRMPEEVH